MNYCQTVKKVNNDQHKLDVCVANENISIQDKKQKLGIKYIECLKNSYINNNFTDNNCYTYILQYNEVINQK